MACGGFKDIVLPLKLLHINVMGPEMVVALNECRLIFKRNVRSTCGSFCWWGWTRLFFLRVQMVQPSFYSRLPHQLFDQSCSLFHSASLLKYWDTVFTLAKTAAHYTLPGSALTFILTGFEVVKSNVLWDIMPCSPLKVNRRFGETSPSSSASKNKAGKKPTEL
jgi:hypothetical protein